MCSVEAQKKRLKNLIVLGKERGYLTYAEVNDHLPDDVLDARRNFLEFDPPKHGRYRRLISTNFTPGAVAV